MRCHAAAIPLFLITGTLFGNLDAQSPDPLSGRRSNFTLHAGSSEVGRIVETRHDNGSMTCAFRFRAREGDYGVALRVDGAGKMESLDANLPSGSARFTCLGDRVELKTSGTRTQRFDVRGKSYVPYSPFFPFKLPEALALGAGQTHLLTSSGLKRVLSAKKVRLGAIASGLPDPSLWLTRLVCDDVTVFVVTDRRQRLIATSTEVKKLRISIVREGFDYLPKVLASGRIETVDFRPRVSVKMRDGVQLLGDLYLPAHTPVPTILIRTPYRRSAWREQAVFFSRHEYAVLVQSCRGRFGSEGRWRPFENEREDGFDTIEWLTKEKFSTRDVGMLGASYSGLTEWYAAISSHQGLKTMIPVSSPTDPGVDWPFENGILLLEYSLKWVLLTSTNLRTDECMKRLAPRMDRIHDLPLIDLDETMFGEDSDPWNSLLRHPPGAEYWKRLSFVSRFDRIDIPVLHECGCFDRMCRGTVENYLAMQRLGKQNQSLVIGPWTHAGDPAIVRGKQLRENREERATRWLEWFDRWLKGKKASPQKPVAIYIPDQRRWRYFDSYPPREVSPLTLFLCGRKREGHCSRAFTMQRQPDHKESYSEFTYDPDDPTPDPIAVDLTRQTVDAEDRNAAKMVVEGRRDLLVFETKPFDEMVTIVGPASVILYAETDGGDTDWVASLYEIDKHGRMFRVAVGAESCQFQRDKREQERAGATTEAQRYRLNLGHVSWVIEKGNALCLVVSSALFPTYARSLNGADRFVSKSGVVAHQRILHGGQFRSRVDLWALE